METKDGSPQKAQRMSERTLEDKVSIVTAKKFSVGVFGFFLYGQKNLIAVDLKGKI